MTMPTKVHETINQFYKALEAGNTKLIKKYTLQDIKDARHLYKHDNSKVTDLGPVMDDRIKELEKISDEKKRRKEKWLDRAITFILGVASGLLISYLKNYFQLK